MAAGRALEGERPAARGIAGGAARQARLLRRLLRAKDRMDQFSHEEWSIRRLADVSGVSEAHFARTFKAAFGVPPHRYLIARRIGRAMALLRDTDRSVTDIALQTGWNSLGTFGRTFRDVTGFSPGDVRRSSAAASNKPPSVPACILSAALRPDLTIAVSEKRRRTGSDRSPSEEQEIL